MSRKNRGRIKESQKPRQEIKESFSPKENSSKNIIINFSIPFSLYSCKIKKDYTNYLENNKNFIDFRRELFGEALEYFNSKTFEQLVANKNGHTHKVAEDKIWLIEKILTELVKKKWPNKKTGMIVGNYMLGEIWQLGYKQGLRLIGVRDDNILNLLFIDYHHLIEPSPKYNDKDHFKYNYCPMTS